MGRLLEPGSDAGARLMIDIRATGNRTRLTGLLTGILAPFSTFESGVIFFPSV
jgi:hypothetical protein